MTEEDNVVSLRNVWGGEGFKVGDVVRLKSGGPPMTVAIAAVSKWRTDITKDWTVACVWFSQSAIVSQTFPPEALVLCAPPKEGSA
jgi:uncharacterized protein YodC (DUF2158 family)